MPYIITVTPQYDPMASTHAERIGQTSHAVATLGEARKAVWKLANDRTTWLTDAWRDALRAAEALPDAGGTIGPLPDGTVIEVRHVCWDDFYMLLPPPLDGMSNAAIIDAYNAR